MLLSVGVNRFGNISEMYVPTESDMTVGYGFIEFEDSEAASYAVAAMDKVALDKKHTYRVSPWG